MNYWQRRLAKTPAKEQPPVPPMPATGIRPYAAQPSAVAEQQPAAPALSAPATSAPAPTGCPQCHSTNFGSPTSNTAPRCFECGYVPGGSYQSAQQGMTGIANEGPVNKTKQVASGGFHPQQIVGRIGD